MSAKWIRVETDFVDHPKVHRLATLVGGESEAIAIIMRMWSWMSRFCPTGHVRDIDGTALGHACKWSREPSELLQHLVTVGLLDTNPDGGWDGHDWADHQGKVAASAEKERERKRRYRAKRDVSVPSLSHGTSSGTNGTGDAQRDVTGRDVTGRSIPKSPRRQKPTDTPEVLAMREAWNTHTQMPIPRWTAGRASEAMAALERRPLEQWVEIFKRVNRSPFLKGMDGKWKADIDWVLRPGGSKPEPALKVLEGSYDAPPSAPPARGTVFAKSRELL